MEIAKLSTKKLSNNFLQFYSTNALATTFIFAPFLSSHYYLFIFLDLILSNFFLKLNTFILFLKVSQTFLLIYSFFLSKIRQHFLNIQKNLLYTQQILYYFLTVQLTIIQFLLINKQLLFLFCILAVILLFQFFSFLVFVFPIQ